VRVHEHYSRSHGKGSHDSFGDESDLSVHDEDLDFEDALGDAPVSRAVVLQGEHVCVSVCVGCKVSVCKFMCVCSVVSCMSTCHRLPSHTYIRIHPPSHTHSRQSTNAT
jgi:hypothetical protein